ncbi:MAG: MFS transporter [Nitrososphaerota archaeon]|nr:MFS transporter [Nitrososphaerota archaeon]MDG7027214.1 MFS transporter [Nitrososphaerota archaeon]
MLSSFRNPRAAGSLIVARVVYAVNWVNFAAVFYLMEPDLHTGVSGLGVLTSAFYLGLGLMQIPGGILAARWGAKRVVVTGIFIYSLSALGTAFATSTAEVAALRFLVGWGMAFVFAPAVIIIAGLIRGEKSGLGVGLLNSAFDVGGILGITGWVVIATVAGWRPSLALSGGLGILTGVLVLALVPGDEARGALPVLKEPLLRVLLDKQLVYLGLGAVGLGIANIDIMGFMTLYGVKALGLSGVLASVLTSLVTIVPIFTALLSGRAFDLISRHKWIMFASLLGSAAALALGSYPSLYAAAACATLGGAVSGIGYTFAFAGARELNRAGKEYESLAVAWVNSISLTGSFAPPLLFSFLAGSYGYQAAWFWSGVATLAFVVPILLTVESWRR